MRRCNLQATTRQVTWSEFDVNRLGQRERQCWVGICKPTLNESTLLVEDSNC